MIDPTELSPLRLAVYEWFLSLPHRTRSRKELGDTVEKFLRDPFTRSIPGPASLRKISAKTKQPIPPVVMQLLVAYKDRPPMADIDDERLMLAVQVVVMKLGLDDPEAVASDLSRLLAPTYRQIMQAEADRGKRLTLLGASRLADGTPLEGQNKQGSPSPKRRR